MSTDNSLSQCVCVVAHVCLFHCVRVPKVCVSNSVCVCVYSAWVTVTQCGTTAYCVIVSHISHHQRCRHPNSPGGFTAVVKGRSPVVNLHPAIIGNTASLFHFLSHISALVQNKWVPVWTSWLFVLDKRFLLLRNSFVNNVLFSYCVGGSGELFVMKHTQYTRSPVIQSLQSKQNVFSCLTYKQIYLYCLILRESFKTTFSHYSFSEFNVLMFVYRYRPSKKNGS